MVPRKYEQKRSRIHFGNYVDHLYVRTIANELLDHEMQFDEIGVVFIFGIVVHVLLIVFVEGVVVVTVFVVGV